MTEDEEHQAILAKIKKALNLATSENANEAANAQAAAQRLLLRHHIDEAELASFSLDKSETVTEVRTSGKNGHNRSNWYNRLASIIAQANLCKILTSGAGLIWIGKPTDIEIAQYLFSMIVNDLTRICEHEWYWINYDQRSLPAHSRQHGKTWKNNFYFGACQTLNQRLTANLQQLKQADNNINALIVRNDIELDEYMQIKHPYLSYNKVAMRQSRSGFEAGKAAGETIQMRQGISAGGSKAIKQLNRG